MSDLLDRNLGLEPVRVTEAAAPAAGHWMDKSAKEAADQVAVDAMRCALAVARDCAVSDPTVGMLERPRTEELARKLRAGRARPMRVPDRDVTSALTDAMEDCFGADMPMGVGRSAGTVHAICALRCLRGEIQCRLWPRNEEEKQRALSACLDAGVSQRILTSDDRSEARQCFLYRKRQYNGELFRGVQYSGHGARP